MTFDTGWGTFTLDSIFCAANPNIIMNNPDSLLQRGSAWTYSTVPTLRYNQTKIVKIGNVPLTYQNLEVFNYKKYFNSTADGAFGIPQQDTIHVWEFNFENNYLEIHQADDFKMPEKCFLLPMTGFFEVQLPMQIKFADGDTLTTNNTYLVDVGMPQDIALIYPTTEFEFFTKRNDAVWTTMDGTNYYRHYNVSATLFENFAVDSLRIYTFDNPQRLKSKYLIGQNFLKRFNVFFDMKNRQLGLQPIKNFQRIVNPNHKRFYFSLTETKEGRAFVSKVADYPNNYIKNGGLQEGDEIVSMNNVLLSDSAFRGFYNLIETSDTLIFGIIRNVKHLNFIIPVDKKEEQGD